MGSRGLGITKRALFNLLAVGSGGLPWSGHAMRMRHAGSSQLQLCSHAMLECSDFFSNLIVNVHRHSLPRVAHSLGKVEFNTAVCAHACCRSLGLCGAPLQVQRG